MPRKQEKTALESLTQPFGKLRDLLRLVSQSNHAQDDTQNKEPPNAYRKPLRTQQESCPNA